MESLTLTETCPDPTFMSISTTAIELKKKEKKNMDKMGKTFLVIHVIFTFGALLLRFLAYSLVFTYYFSAIKKFNY